MIICPHCGAENADNTDFCSLCLARFGASGGVSDTSTPHNYPPPQQAQQQQQYVSPGDFRALAQEMAQNPQGGYGDTAPRQGYQPPQQQQPYVSPGDYRALAQEMAQNPQGGYRDTAYYQAAMQHPGAISAVQAPAHMKQRSAFDIVIMLVGYSLATTLLVLVCELFISLWLLGAAFGGSKAGLNFGRALIYIADGLLLILGGYAISAKAMHAGKGWIYGAGCAACAVFVWMPLALMLLMLFLTGEVYVPLFTLVGVLISLFLYLPLGALGGWIAEKRLIG